MDFFRIIQFVYVVFFLISTGILACAALAVINWPQIRGRGLLLAALVVRLIAVAGYLLMGIVQIVSMLGQFGLGLSGSTIQGVYMLLAACGLVGDGLLMLSLISLAGALRHVQLKGSLTDSTLHNPFGKS